MQNLNYKNLSQHTVFVAWVIAAMATFTSLALSEVWNFIPCKLCWYQRIFLFAAAVVLSVGVLYKDARVYRYVLPLTVTGGAIALYHVLLQWGIVPEALTCSLENSCATKQFEWFGFVTIPFLSLLTFVAISCLMLVQMKMAEPARENS